MLKAIAALGNPGYEYATTRHNFGWLVADEVISRCGLGRRSRAETYDWFSGRYKGTELTVFKPLTYMNRSGWAVNEFCRRQHLDIGELLVVYDDIDIDFGKLKLRTGGGDGGHKGIRSIINESGRCDFHRLRLGIKPELRPESTPDYVLEPFSSLEEPVLERVIPAAASAAIDCFFSEPELVMNNVNRLDFSPDEK